MCDIRAKFPKEAPMLTRVLLSIANLLFQPTRESVEAYSALVKEVNAPLNELMANFQVILMVKGASAPPLHFHI